ncbi:MAG TPA: EAL domain-containing protein [Allosphingosinicella sp.]|jgi:diguanylate cyclase (GGDEF)-like protein
MSTTWNKISNGLLSLLAGLAAFLFTLAGFLLVGEVDQQIVASLFIGLFALMVVHLAGERPNAAQARATTALIDRLLEVHQGDLSSPAPAVLRNTMPALAAAVDGLFEQVRSSLENFRTMAMYDPVTALPNRIHFRREADRVLKDRRDGDRTALLFIDLDGFKEVNDRLGHAQGDQMLIMVANRLRVVVKAEGDPEAPSPLLARLAGDEFTILLPSVGSAEEAERIAARALAALSEPFSSLGQSSNIGASIGIAICPDHGTELPALMKAADIAMYHAKSSGRSRVCLFDGELARASEQRAAFGEGLRVAIEQDELALVYEPRLCLRSGAILAGDVSLRWRRPNGESLSIDILDTAIEDAGLEHQLSNWTLASSLGAYGRWREADLPQRLCVRLSPRQVERADFAEGVFAALAAEAKRHALIELELPAASLLFVRPHVCDQLKNLRRLGVTITVGDFGGAGMDLGVLTRLPVDRVKFAPAVVAEIDRDQRARTILSSILHLVHGLDCEAIAVGAHRQEQLEVLRAAGCDAVQGFFGLEPMEEEAFVAWIAAQDCARSLARAS